MDPPAKRCTYEDLLALPEAERGEIIDGRMILAPGALPRHSKAQRSLASFIGGPFDDEDGRGGPGGWWILLEVDVRFDPHQIVRPDLAGWRRDRLTDPWDQRPIDVRPDWICEVLSPSNAGQDRVRKRHLYAQYHVPYYWLVDPFERTLEALRLEGGQWVDAGTFDESAKARIPPFAEIELEVGRLFIRS